MKKLIPFFVCLLAINTSIAQDKHKDDKPHKITFIGGFNFATQVSSDNFTDGFDSKTGLILGINKDVKIIPMLWLHGGIQYIQNGADTDFGDLKLNYLTVPIGAKLRFGPLYALAGGYSAYRLNAKLDDEDLSSGDYNRLDFGLYAGAGVKVLLFTLNVKYNIGLSDVSNGSSDMPDFDLQNRSLSVTLGVGIP